MRRVRVRACGAAGPCRPAGSWSRSGGRGPRPSAGAVFWLTSRPGERTRISIRCHLVGVSRISSSLLVTRLAVRSTMKCSVTTTGTSAVVGAPRRTAARRRARSSSIPKDLVTLPAEGSGPPPTADGTAGRRPPTRATATTASRTSSTGVAWVRSVRCATSAPVSGGTPSSPTAAASHCRWGWRPWGRRDAHAADLPGPGSRMAPYASRVPASRRR